jgi:hypothetical protein
MLENIWVVKRNSLRSISVDHFTIVDDNIPDGALTREGTLIPLGVNKLYGKTYRERYTCHEITQRKKQVECTA